MKSLRKAINNMCKECIYDPVGGNGTWTKQVEDCTSPKCSLYDVRPLTEETTQLRAVANRKKTGKKLPSSAFKPGHKVHQ